MLPHFDYYRIVHSWSYSKQGVLATILRKLQQAIANDSNFGFSTTTTLRHIALCLSNNSWAKQVVMPQPSYSSDLATCDFLPFPKVQRCFK